MGAMTKLQAVNEMLESIGLKPVAALDTGGSSDAAQAERVLDRESRRVQTAGFYGNTIRSKKYTAASNKVQVGSDVISIKAAGPTQYRNFDLRGDGAGNQLVYDLDNDTSTISTSTEIWLDIVVEISFANCPPYIQDTIVGQAKQIFARRTKMDPERDQALAEERVRAEARADRASGRNDADRSNPAPFALGGGQAPRG